MPYNPNIPVATDKLSSSQADLLGNFTALGTIVDPNDPTLKLTQRAVDPAAAANQLQFYTKAIGATTELFMLRGVGAAIDCTSSLKADQGWTMLPSGMRMAWGWDVSSNPVLFAAPFPTAVYSVSLTLNVGVIGNHYWVSVDPGAGGLTVNGFTAHAQDGNGNDAAGQAFYYIAIGY